MHEVTPRIRMISYGDGDCGGMAEYCETHGYTWRPDPDVSSLENVFEFGGRLCYTAFVKEDGSFDNKNLSKTRQGNDAYLGNIIKQEHGSVMEHGPIIVLFEDVSRVFTHEIVRHRVGTAMSQESGRFVSMDDMGFWFPPELKESRAFKRLETLLAHIECELKLAAGELGLHDEGVPFSRKKILQSALRRLAPNGQANNILFSFNIRSLRHIINMRSSKGAEVEIAMLFTDLGQIAKDQWPNAFQDMTMGDDGFWKFEHHF